MATKPKSARDTAPVTVTMTLRQQGRLIDIGEKWGEKAPETYLDRDGQVIISAVVAELIGKSDRIFREAS